MKNQRLLIWLNVGGIILLIISGGLFLFAITWLRPVDGLGGVLTLELSSLIQALVLIIWVLLLTMFYVILHEAIHGACFWLFTKAQPKFAFRWTHAYAAAPNWYLPRNQYLVTGLAPLVVITVFGLAAALLVPSGWLLPLWYILTMNASGAIGDLMVAVWLLRQPANCLANDRGEAITLYLPRAA